MPEPDDLTWSVRMADSMLRRYPVSLMRWRYEDGFLMRAIEQAGLRAGDHSDGETGARYCQAVLDYVGRFVDGDGNIATYQVTDYNLDQVMPGRLLFGVHRANGKEHYRRAITLQRAMALLVGQLRLQPRTRGGGFWHKLIYPYQMWLDGIYMACPFYTEYAATFDEPAAFDDVLHQIVTIEELTRDRSTGLLHHAWDESRQQRWSDPQTGRSPHVWCRAMGWFVMALVDVLDYLPSHHPGYDTIVGVLLRAMDGLLAAQDPATGLWRQVLDQGNRMGNYLESSGSCMIVYAMAKGARTGRLPGCWLDTARLGYRQILDQFVRVDDRGETHLHGTCGMAGLGGDPYRDGSYEYYIGEPVVTDEPKGVAAFILASVEVEAGEALDQRGTGGGFVQGAE